MGIRDIAMSKGNKNPETHYLENQYTQYDYDYYEDYDPYPEYNKMRKNYKKNKKEEIIIEIEINNKEIGKIAEINDPNYDFNKAKEEAEEIGIKKLMELAGKDIKLRYHIETIVEDWVDYMIVEMKLTKRNVK